MRWGIYSSTTGQDFSKDCILDGTPYPSHRTLAVVSFKIILCDINILLNFSEHAKYILQPKLCGISIREYI